MIDHIVLMKLTSGVDDPRLPEAIAALESMREHVSGILEIVAGPNTSPEGKDGGYDFALLVRFESAEARDAYLSDPYHLQVAQEHIRDLIGELIVVDLEHSA